MNILVINAGSSSLKYQLIDMNDETVLAKGICEKIAQKESGLIHIRGEDKFAYQYDIPDHKRALELVFGTLCSEECGVIRELSEVNAIGHRVLHGAEDYKESVIVTDEVLKICHKNRELGPLHMPANILCIEICKELLDVPQVAVFDTSFHQTMPEQAYRYAIPEEDYLELRLRRYGFHGTSHKYVSGEAIRLMKREEPIKLITCHLGNGSSIAAIFDGHCMDTSMGFTPLEGVPMGTRSGDLDPAVIEHIMVKRNITDIAYMCDVYLNKKSGMLGLAGTPDFRDLEKANSNGDARARLALELFAYRVKKYIGAYAAALGGVDCIVLTGGIGENAYHTRRRILENLEFLGIDVDWELNKSIKGSLAKISSDKSTVTVYVIPTNEELVIARDTMLLVCPPQAADDVDIVGHA